MPSVGAADVAVGPAMGTAAAAPPDLYPDSRSGRIQSAQGLQSLFFPRTIAVVGASSRADAIGHLVLARILDGGFTGTVHPVNRNGDAVLGRRGFRSVLEIPGNVDLAVIVVPAAAVVAVVEECGRKGVKGLVVVSAGFRETRGAGAHREQELRAAVHRHGMRMVGPNCLGILNGSPGVRLNATFAHLPLAAGGAALMAQSGALGIAVLNEAHARGLGVGRFASLGNKADVSGNDLLLLWEADPEVRQVLLYLESFGNPHNFRRIAPRVSRSKPVFAVKSGRTSQGARAAGSHTGALAEPDLLVDALLEEAGVVRCATVEDLLDAAVAFDAQGLPPGGRVAIVTNSGGPAIMAVDALAAAGLEPAPLSEATVERLRAVLPPEASLANPLDLIASAGPRQFAESVRAVLEDNAVDALLVVHTAVLGTGVDVAQAIVDAARQRAGKPVLAVFFGGASGDGARALRAGGIPAYAFPEDAVRALGALHRAAALRARPAGRHPDLRPQAARAGRLVHRGREREGGWLRQDDALALLDCYGVPVAPHRFARTPNEVADAARELGIVVVKAEAEGLVHKTEAGAVRVGLQTPAAARDAAAAMAASVEAAGHRLEGFLVLRHEAPGTEVLIGAARDPRFGPVVGFGLGGIFAEALHDVAFRLAPVTDEEALRLVQSIRGAAVLAGARGRPPCDVAAVADVVLRVSRLAAEVPGVLEVDVNPFFARAAGGVAVDARVRVVQRHAGSM